MKFKDKTRGEYPLTIYTTGAGGDRPIHAAITIESGEVRVLDWPASGRYRPSGQPHPYDLIPLREPSEAAVEAAWDEWVASRPFDPCAWKAGKRAFRKAMAAAYEIDFPEGGK